MKYSFFILVLFSFLMSSCVTLSSKTSLDKKKEKEEKESGEPLIYQRARKKLVDRAQNLLKEKIKQKSLQKRQKLVQLAKNLTGNTKVPSPYRNDCSGFVDYLYKQISINLLEDMYDYPPDTRASKLMYLFCEKRGFLHQKEPEPADLVFFHNTYGKNRRKITHVGIVVEKEDEDETLYIVHKISRGIVKDPMNIQHKTKHSNEKGKILNAYLRKRSFYDTQNHIPHLAGELFTSFCTVIQEEK